MQSSVNISIEFCLKTALYNLRRMSSNFLIIPTSGTSSRPAAFLLLIFLNTTSSSFSINCPNLMSSRPLIIFIGFSVISAGFPNRFLKCSFYFQNISFWRLLAFLSGCFTFYSLNLLSTMLFVIVYLQTRFCFYRFCLESILIVLFGVLVSSFRAFSTFYTFVRFFFISERCFFKVILFLRKYL